MAGAALAALWLAGCQPARQSTRPAETSDPYLVSASELESSVRVNLYDALLELRPRWFTRRNRNEPYVYADDQLVGTVGALRRFAPRDVAEVRYMSPTEAQVLYGQRNYGRPAIVLRFGRQ